VIWRERGGKTREIYPKEKVRRAGMDKNEGQKKGLIRRKESQHLPESHATKVNRVVIKKLERGH